MQVKYKLIIAETSNEVFPKVLPCLYQSTVLHWNTALNIMNKQYIWECRATSTNHKSVADLGLFYKRSFGEYSTKLTQLLPRPHSCGRPTQYFEDMQNS